MDNKLTETEDKSVKLDEILKKLGTFNRYQIRTILFISLAFFINEMHMINYIFVVDKIDYRCKIDKCESGPFEAPWYNLTAPIEYKNCHKYENTNNSDCSAFGFNAAVIEPCDGWLYENENSFVSEFQLACQDWKRTFVGTVHSMGLMIGLFLQGQLSDRIGRKAAIIIAGVAAAVFGISKSFAKTYPAYIFLEFLEATFGDNSGPAFIMSVEAVHTDHRLELQLIFSLMIGLSGLTIALLAYYVTYWRHLVLAFYVPSFVFIFYYFFVDDSIRWLLSKGKKNEATKILVKMAKSKGIELDKNTLDNIKCEGAQNSPLRDTFRSKIVVRRFLVCLVWWTSCTFIFFGLMVNVVSLAGNKYINFALLSFSDVPSCFAMVYALRKFQRKRPLIVSFLTTGLLCLFQPLVPKSYVWLSTGLYIIGKFVITFAFICVGLYTSELFPTYTRNSMHSLCSAIGRIGSIIAPMTPLLAQYMESLPTLLIGAISIIAGLTTLLVPDFDNEPLPDNVQQAENLGRTHENKTKCTEE